MRRLTVILLSFAVCCAFVEAPFMHVHRHEGTQHHPGAFLHLHLRSIHPASSGPEFRNLDPSDDAQFQNWFAATMTASLFAPAILPEAFVLAAPEFSGWAVEAPLPSGHDPPLLRIKNPRAPPA